MDTIAEARWRDERPPFDGLTLATGVVATDQLLAAAVRLVPLLRNAFPGVVLQTAEDWHEHDGYISESEPAEWDALELAVSSQDAFEQSSPDDTDVRRAWLADGSFYLRWFLYDEGDSPYSASPPAGGDLDLTAARDVTEDALRALRETGIDAEVEPACEFFARRWNG